MRTAYDCFHTMTGFPTEIFNKIVSSLELEWRASGEESSVIALKALNSVSTLFHCLVQPVVFRSLKIVDSARLEYFITLMERDNRLTTHVHHLLLDDVSYNYFANSNKECQRYTSKVLHLLTRFHNLRSVTVDSLVKLDLHHLVEVISKYISIGVRGG